MTAVPATGGPRRRALLAGASGLVGRRLLARLLADPGCSEVHALVRRPLPAEARPAPDASVPLREHLVDYDWLERGSVLPGADDLFVCLGTTLRAAGSQEAFRRIDFDAVLAVARLARRLGATRLGLVSAIGADPASRVFYNRVKGETEAALARLDYPSLVVLRPALLVGERDQFRPAERIGLLLARPLGRLLPARLRPVPAEAVARCLLDAVRRGEPGLRILESDRIQAFAG